SNLEAYESCLNANLNPECRLDLMPYLETLFSVTMTTTVEELAELARRAEVNVVLVPPAMTRA
ncbi:hypothetical protein, partial [Mesorhizobium amorphae]|uniref:hypothetical protein n=1 Tax=Mesorhizobium amorphae TaxID=71433 RepID=UPI001AED8EA1